MGFPIALSIPQKNLASHPLSILPVEKKTMLGHFGAFLPATFDPAWKPRALLAICEDIEAGRIAPPPGMTVDAAAWWARRLRSNLLAAQGWSRVEQRKNVWFIALDRTWVQEQAILKYATAKLEAAAAADPTRDPTGNQLDVARASQRALASTADLDSFWTLPPDYGTSAVLKSLGATSEAVLTESRANSPTFWRRLRIVLAFEVFFAADTDDDIWNLKRVFSIGPDLSLQLTNDLAITAIWQPFQYFYPSLPGGNEWSVRADAGGFRLDYQVPLRIQASCCGLRPQISVGWRRLAADTDIPGLGEFETQGSAYEIGIGLTTRSRPRFKGGHPGITVGAYWRFGHNDPFTRDDGAVLVSALTGNEVRPEGDGLSLRLMFGYGF